MKLNLKNLTRIDYFKIVLPFVVGLVHYFVRRNLWGSSFYILGWFLGMLLLILDKNYLYKYYYESIHRPEDKFARLVTRSLLFILSYFALSLFLITSSGSSLGMGIILGIGLSLSYELWNSRTYVDFFNQYFIQSKKVWKAKEIDNLVKVFIAFYLFIIVLSVI